MRIERGKTRTRRNGNKWLILTAIVLSICIFILISIIKNGTEKKEVALISEETETISLVCAGDILIHSPQLESQFFPETNEFSFINNFKYVKPYIEEGDLSLGSFEVTLPGEPPYAGYPNFKAPDALVPAFTDAGFNVSINASNHLIDGGSETFLRTIEFLKSQGLSVVGSHLPEDKAYEIIEVKNVKVGVIAYTYETIKQEGRRSLNGVPIPESIANCINSFDPSDLPTDLPLIKANLDQMKKDGAEIIVFYAHWGEEYSKEIMPYQEEMSNFLVAEGVDVIFGSHPHVIEPIVIKDGVPIFYALGNFLSNQRAENVDNAYTEDGLIGRVDFVVTKKYQEEKGTKVLTDTQIKLEKVEALPTWVHKYNLGKLTYEIIPFDGKEYPILQESGNLERRNGSLERTKEILGVENYNEEKLRFIYQ